MYIEDDKLTNFSNDDFIKWLYDSKTDLSSELDKLIPSNSKTTINYVNKDKIDTDPLLNRLINGEDKENCDHAGNSSNVTQSHTNQMIQNTSFQQPRPQYCFFNQQRNTLMQNYKPSYHS